MKKVYAVIRTGHKSRVWALPDHLLRQLSLVNNQNIILKFGSASAEVRITTLNSESINNECFGLSNELMNIFSIPDNIFLSIKPLGNNKFQLGPLIGLLAFSAHLPGKLHYYKRYFDFTKNKCLFFVFGRRGINKESQTITGYRYDYRQNNWATQNFPLPDVVIDRRYPNQDSTNRLLTQMIGKDKIFNRKTMITKVDFHDALKNNPYLKDYLPKTRIFTGSKDLEYFISKYGTAILKPVNSMKGSGIVAATRSNKGIECRYKMKGEEITKIISSDKEIFNLLAIASGRKRKYIIQQGISCLEYLDAPFSLRTCPTKNGQGQWVIPGMLALGLGKSFITNYSAGAQRIPLQKLFTEILPRLPYTRQEFIAKINHLSINAASLLDKEFGPLGELGIDIIIDKQGKPWLLEANGNPGKIPIFYQHEYPDWPWQVYELPLQFAYYLAGFGK